MLPRLLTAALCANGACNVLASSSPSTAYRPIVLWHGMGDSCCDPRSMGKVMASLSQTLPGVYLHSVHVGGTSADEEKRASFFGTVNVQVDQVCQHLKADEKLAGGFNAIGFSQGGQFLRAYVERCNDPPVHRLVTFGSQHGGVSDVPNCANRNDFTCRAARSAVRSGAYLPAVQSRIVQAQYYKDPQNVAKYLQSSLFLADINNEREVKNVEYARRLATLDKFIMVRFTDDKMVTPKETAWFWFYDAQMNLVPLHNQTLYTEDWIGLRELDQRGALHFLDSPGEHMQISLDYLANKIVLPYLSDPVMGADSSSARSPPLVIQA